MMSIPSTKKAFFNKLEFDKELLKTVIERETVTYSKDAVYVTPKCNFFIDNNFMYKNDEDDRFCMKGFSTPASMLMLDGKPKSRKTTFAYMMAAAALKADRRYQNIFCTNDINNWVMIFDTEQSPGEFFTKIDGLKMMAEDDELDRVHAHNFVKYGHNPEMKIQAINHYVYELDKSYRRNGVINEKDRIGLIILDHMGHLVNNENDRDEVKELIGWMSQMANDTGATILGIIHQNKNNKEATGVIGYEFAKAASSYLKTFKIPQDGEDGDVDTLNPTEVYFKDNRFGAKPFRRFIFNYDDYGYPVVLDHKQINYNFMG
jgi:AAA domain